MSISSSILWLTEHPMDQRLTTCQSPSRAGSLRRENIEETMAGPTITLNITRYRPGQDRAPTTQSYAVPYKEDWVVLDALNHIKDQIDGTLSYRWSCRMGVCGSCGMMVHGEPKLTCAAFLKDYYPSPIRVEPLTNFPVIRDLIINLEDFLHKLKELKTWIIPKESK